MAGNPGRGDTPPPELPKVPALPTLDERNRRSTEAAVALGQRRLAASAARIAAGTSTTPRARVRASSRLAARNIITPAVSPAKAPPVGRFKSGLPKAPVRQTIAPEPSTDEDDHAVSVVNESHANTPELEQVNQPPEVVEESVTSTPVGDKPQDIVTVAPLDVDKPAHPSISSLAAQIIVPNTTPQDMPEVVNFGAGPSTDSAPAHPSSPDAAAGSVELQPSSPSYSAESPDY